MTSFFPSLQVGGGDAWKLYDFIVRTFIGSVSPDLTYLQTTIKYKIGSEIFVASGKQVSMSLLF